MTKVAKVLKIMVDSGLYAKARYMCVALDWMMFSAAQPSDHYAKEREKALDMLKEVGITNLYDEACLAIAEYLSHLDPSLRLTILASCVAQKAGLTLPIFEVEWFMSLYSDWDNRPMTKQQCVDYLEGVRNGK